MTRDDRRDAREGRATIGTAGGGMAGTVRAAEVINFALQGSEPVESRKIERTA